MIAQAHIYRQQGIQARGSRKEAEFVDSFEKALGFFRSAELTPLVVSCLEDLNRFTEAAGRISGSSRVSVDLNNIYLDIRMTMGRSHYSRAAELYIKGDDFAKASDVYNTMGEYGRAASTLLRGDLFDNFAKYLAEYVLTLTVTYRF
jgi:hypothetical protein